MNKLDAAIKHFKVRANRATHDQVINDSMAVADALEEIRDLLTADKQPNAEEQPATFAPWDCVKAKPGSHLEQYTDDAELVLGHRDLEGDWKVFNPDDAGERGVLYCQDNEIVFVRRLKPRAQAEPVYTFQGITGINTGYEPTFKRGEYVENIFDVERFIYEVMQDTNGPRVQLRDCKTGQPIAFDADDLRKVDKPAAFQVGDWAEELPTGNKVQILKVFSTYSTVEDNSGRRYNRANGHLKKIDPPAAFAVGDWVRDTRDGAEFQIEEIDNGFVGGHIGERTIVRDSRHFTKIDPPAPRFTFGDRVRVEWGEIDHIFLGYDHYGTHADVIGPDKNIHNIPIALISATPLDTDAD